MRKSIIAGNWKMYKSAKEATEFVEQLLNTKNDKDKVDAVICPPSLYIAELSKLTKQSSLSIGAQNMHAEKEGAFTGEVSPSMLQDIGVKYVILGHSERRQYFNETDVSVNQKTQAAFEHQLTPIVCVGESLEEREAGKTVQKVENQVTQAFKEVSAENAAVAVIAYEPIWAIGTGKTATAEDANEVCGAIRKVMANLYGAEIANQIRIQYGGSVNPSNIVELLSMEHIDGALVGGASLNPESFSQLLEAGQNA